MSGESSSDVGLLLGRSRRLTFLLFAVHAGALLIALLLPIQWWWQLVIAVAIVGSLFSSAARHALRLSPSSVVAFALDEGDVCRWRYRDSKDWVSGRLIDRWVHAPLTLLRVREHGRWRSTNIVIPADAVTADAFRRLRVRLTLQNGAE